MRHSLLALVVLGPLAIFMRSGARLEAQTAAQTQLFEKSVRPLLAENCFSCHANDAMGGLRLDSKDALLKGGNSGPAIVPGDPDKSLLMSAVRHSGALKMPLGGERLSDAQIGALATWIRDGAVWTTVDAGTKPEAVLADHFESHIRPVLAQQCFA